MSTKKEHPRIMEAIFTEQWAILPDYLDKIVSIATGHGDIEAALALREMRQVDGAFRTGKTPNGTAIIPVFGPLVPRAGMMTNYSGATSFQQLQHDLEAAIADPEVRQIVFNIDSPGGTVTGNEELGAAIREAATKKKVVAYVSGQAASAAYWLASACQEIYGLETSMYGSIGTVVTLYDDKESLKQQGIVKYDVVSSVSPHKRPDISTKEGRSHYQSLVDAMADVFVSKVAEYRGVSISTVLEKFGGGAMYLGREAVSRGMADGITTLENLLTYGATMADKAKPPAPSAEAPTAPVEGTQTTSPSASAPAISAPAISAADITKSPEFASAVAQATAQALAQHQASEAERIASCESLKTVAPAFSAFIDREKMKPGMTKTTLMEAILGQQSKVGAHKANYDADLQNLNQAAEAVAQTSETLQGEDAEMAGAVSLMVQGAASHSSRQYTALADGNTNGAKLKV